MPKVETNIKRVVGFVTFLMLMISGSSAFAVDPAPTPANTSDPCTYPIKRYEDASATDRPNMLRTDPVLKACVDKIRSSSNDQCQTASKDFNKARSEFNSACSTAGFSSAGSYGLGCYQDILDCSQCSDSDASEGNCTRFADDNDSGSSSSGSNKYAQLCGMKQNSGLSLDEWNKELKDTQNKIDDLNQKTVDLVSDNMDKAQNIEQQTTDAQKAYRDSVQQTKKNFEQQQEDLEKHLDDMSAQVKQSGDHITQIRQKMRDAKVALDAQISNLDLQCHSKALDQIKELQKQRQAMIQTGTYNVGSFNSLFKNHVGKKSQLQLDQQAAQTLYLQCQQDQEYLKGVQTAQETYNAAVQSMNENITSLMQDQSTTLSQRERDRIEKSQKILNDNQQEINNATQDYTTTMQNLAKQKQQAAQQMQQKQMLYQQQLAKAQKDLNDLKAKGPKDKDKSDAYAKYNDLQSQAESFLDACRGGDLTKPAPGNYSTAFQFLTKIGDSTVDGFPDAEHYRRGNANPAESGSGSGSGSGTNGGASGAQ